MLVPRPVTVAKLGGSVLGGPEDLRAAVDLARGEGAHGRALLLVVSAFRGETDRRIDQATRERLTGDARARFVGGGEEASAERTLRALRDAGLGARLMGPEDLGLVGRGERLDADPVDLDLRALQAALAAAAVVVVPGYVCLHEDGGRGLLGRGGSDLTAVFLAERLGLATCCFHKDVDGIERRDPSSGEATGRYRTIPWDEALALGSLPLQRKALERARDAGVELVVRALESTAGTRVGDCRVEVAPLA